MDLRKVYLSTLLTELPTIINYNNDEFKRYIDLFYSESLGILTVPLTTTGRVKGATGEFVNVIVDNLTVKNQFTNLYDNNTTADYNWYRMIVDPVFVPRDPCTASTFWPYEPSEGFKFIDVNKPYYRVTNEFPIILNNNNLSQVVGIFFDASTVGTLPLSILLDPDPCSGTYLSSYTVDPSYAGEAYIELIATKYDPSWGSTWDFYKYAYEGTGGGGGGGGVVGPGTPGYIPQFKTTTTIGDSSVFMSGDYLIARDVQVNNSLRDNLDNPLLAYSTHMYISDPAAEAAGRDVFIYGQVFLDASLFTQSITANGQLEVVQSAFFDSSVKTKDIYIENAIRDTSGNILIGYGSPMQLNDPLAVRDVCIYGPNVWIDGSLNAKDVSITGHTDISGTIAMFVDGSMYLNGDEIGTGKYKGEGLDDDLEMVEQYGDLGPGTTVADLRGKTFEWLFSAILFPTVEPTLTPPQMTAFTLTPTTGLSTYQEVGATININTSASFSRGSINPQFSAASPFRSGLPNTYTYTGSGLPASVPSTSTTDSQSISSYVVVIGQQPYWTCSVSYDAGVQPKTNKGVDYDSPLPAGTTSALQRRFEGVYPLFATTSSISNPDTKQNLVSMLSGTNIEIILVDQPDLTNKQSFDIPVPWTGAPTNRPLQNVQTYNTVSSQWETTGIGQWLPTSPVTHTIQGNLINYTRYIWNGAPRGTTRIRLVF